jgi:hypothetical protein
VTALARLLDQRVPVSRRRWRASSTSGDRVEII